MILNIDTKKESCIALLFVRFIRLRGATALTSDTTTIDLLASYFHEDDKRLRIQKQLCQRDPTGVLGCLANRRDYGVHNYNSNFVGVLTSREFLAVNGIPGFFGFGSLYAPDAYSTATNPRDPRVVNTDFTPEYFSDEEQYQARIDQELGSFKLQLTGFYHKTSVNSRQDYNLAVLDRRFLSSAPSATAPFGTGLNATAAAAAGAIPGLPASYFTPIAAALFPGGPTGQLCTSDTEETGTGAYGGFKNCAATPLDYDRSNQKTRDWSAEAILTSDLDGPFNFLLGGIYVDAKLSENSYYVNSFGIDYLTGILGTFTALGSGRAPSYLATPFFRNNTDLLTVKSYGLFGEGYYEFSDKLKLTLGLRYNNDKKFVRARSTLASFITPFTSTNAFTSQFAAGFDADTSTICPTTNPVTFSQATNVPGAIGSVSGCEAFQNRKVSFSEFTGRAVIDFKITDDSLLYASYSRGYKSGGINPPVQPVFAVPDGFDPEFIDSFEVGSKNVFANGKFIFNLTGFYYKYKSLQLSRIVARTAVNDNVDANIYGIEAEAIVRPTREFAVNMGFSYLHTKVSEDKFLSNPRDPGGGRSDAVIIKDITNGSNCAVVPNTAGNAAGVNTLVGAFNSAIGLRAPTAFPGDGGIASTGAFSICSALAGTIAAPSAPLRALFATPTGALPFTVLNAGVAVNINGNKLPQAPNFKWSVGAQYVIEMDNDWVLTPRVDLSYTGDSFGNIFNGGINRVQGYAQANAQIQLDGPDDRWFVRGFVQNIFDSTAITGLYVTDQSSGLFTNIFTLEPRRYGIAAGVKF